MRERFEPVNRRSTGGERDLGPVFKMEMFVVFSF